MYVYTMYMYVCVYVCIYVCMYVVRGCAELPLMLKPQLIVSICIIQYLICIC